MEAGRELDAQIAEKVMGFELMRDTGMVRSGFTTYRLRFKVGWREEIVPRYSTDIAAAWEVVVRMATKHGAFFNLIYDNRSEVDSAYWFCDYSPEYRSGIGVKAELAPLAICLSALKAVGVELEHA